MIKNKEGIVNGKKAICAEELLATGGKTAIDELLRLEFYSDCF